MNLCRCALSIITCLLGGLFFPFPPKRSSFWGDKRGDNMRRNWKEIKRSTWIHADELRLEQTPFEKMLWKRIRASQLGVKFRRQHPIGPYIVDFCCPQCHLIIEIDGDTHADPEAQEYESLRTQYLIEKKWTILRYTNRNILHNLDNIVQDISKQIGI